MEEKDLEQTQNTEVEQVENAEKPAVEEVADVEANVEEVQTEKTKEVSVQEKQAKTKAVKEKKQKVKKEKSKKKTEEDMSQYEGLSDDELYAKIQTQKLLKRKQQKRTATLIGMCFAFVLALVVIILAAVPVSLKPNCMEKGFYSVALYPGTTASGGAFDEGSDDYKQFIKAYDKAFSQPYIAAIFSGSLFSYDIEENMTTVSSVIGPGGSLVQNNQYYVRLRYAEEQKLTNRNGRLYKSRWSNNSTWDGKLTFTEVYFEVSQKAGIQETKVYVVANGYPITNKDTTTIESRIITITVKADTHAIYNVWADLTK